MPASAAAIPPWIAQPADPAAHYQAGFQIGVHTGAQQAAQMFQAQQLALQHRRELMAEQQQAFEDQMNTQVLNLKAAETARKFAAGQEFRARVASGEDPSNVLLSLAPDLGESAASILHSQAMRDDADAMMRFRQDREARVAAQNDERIATANRRADEAEKRLAISAAGGDIAAKREARLQAKDRAQALSKLQQNEEIQNLTRDVKVARNALTEIDNQRWWSQANKDAAKKRAQDNLRVTQSAFDARRKELMQELGIAEPEQTEESGTPEPTTSAPAVQPSEKVIVKGPDGKRYRLPKNQLEEAQRQGYTLSE